MLDIGQVWARQQGRFPGRLLWKDFRYQVLTATYALGANGTSSNQAVTFGQNSIVLGVGAAASPTGQAATQTNRPGLDMFSCSLSYQADNRQIIGTTEAVGSAVFGVEGDMFPGYEIVVSQNGALVWNFTNLTTTAITITLAHHALVPLAS